jgi:hypothetical protein
LALNGQTTITCNTDNSLPAMITWSIFLLLRASSLLSYVCGGCIKWACNRDLRELLDDPATCLTWSRIRVWSILLVSYTWMITLLTSGFGFVFHIKMIIRSGSFLLSLRMYYVAVYHCFLLPSVHTKHFSQLYCSVLFRGTFQNTWYLISITNLGKHVWMQLPQIDSILLKTQYFLFICI